MQTTVDQDHPEYQDSLSRVPVLLLTPEELEGILDDMQYGYDEKADLDDQTLLQSNDYKQLVDGNPEQREEQDDSDIVARKKRQVTQEAMDIALSHTDHNGNKRPVGRIHGPIDVNGIHNDRNNHHIQAGLGLGSVVYRSNNGRHSLGVGAYGTQGQGRSQGYEYKTQPQWGAGIGYKFRF